MKAHAVACLAVIASTDHMEGPAQRILLVSPSQANKNPHSFVLMCTLQVADANLRARYRLEFDNMFPLLYQMLLAMVVVLYAFQQELVSKACNPSQTNSTPVSKGKKFVPCFRVEQTFEVSRKSM